jgi:methylmalonyl-CoA carboxyltransferase large subunit
MPRTTTKDLANALEHIQSQLEKIAARVDRLEAETLKPAIQTKGGIPASAPESPAHSSMKPEVSEEEMIAISAALAAYLGVRVRIKQIRLLSTRLWAQQGRVSIQASHNLHN